MLAKVQRIAFLLVCAALLLGLAASGSSAEETAISKGPFPYTSIRLLELQYGPKKYVNKYVTFECKFSRTGELYKPVQTGLLPELHQNFYAWDSLLPLWIPDKRAKLACLTLYMLKTSVSYNDFMKLKPYQRVVVWGSVRSDLSGQPWIEVRQLDTVSGPSLDEDFYTAMYQGYMQLMAENYTKALGFLSRNAKRSLPPFEEGALCGMLGECYFFLGNYKMATRYFDRACDLNPGDKKLAAFLVKALYFARNYPRSKDVAEKLLTVDPSLAEIRCYLALSKGRTGMVEEGLADVKAALNADPMLTFAYEVQSDLFAMKNDLTSAIAAIEKAVSLEPTNVRYQYRRAELYEESGDIAKAKEGYGYALSIKKDYAPASLALARLAMKEGDKEAAMKLVQSAAKADASAETLFAIGRLYYSFGDKDKALEYFQMTLDADPTFVDALDYAGMVSLSAGRLEAAREYFTRSLEALPDGKDARMGFCRALLWQEKDTHKALEMARALATDYSSDPAANAILGYALTLEGSLEEGAKLIASSIQAQPAEAEFQFYMGVNLFKQKKYSEAIPYLNTACKYEPFNVIGVKYLDAATSEAGKANARLEKDERSRQEQLKREQDKKAAAQERAKRDEDRRKAAIARAEARRAQAAAAKPGERPTTGVRKAAQPAATTRVEKPAQPAGTPPGAKRISREEAETTKDRPLILVREPRKPEPVAKAAPFEILLDRTPAAPKEWYKKYGHKPAPTEHPSIEVAPPKMAWLPSKESTKAEIEADMKKRSEPVENKRTYDLEKRFADAERQARERAKTRERMQKEDNAANRSSAYRSGKAKTKVQAARAQNEHDTERRLYYAAKDAEHAKADFQERMDKFRKNYAEFVKSLDVRRADEMARWEKTRADAAEQAGKLVEASARQAARDEKEAAEMRKFVSEKMSKIADELAREELRVIAENEKRGEIRGMEIEARFAALKAELENRQKLAEDLELQMKRTREKMEADRAFDKRRIAENMAERAAERKELESKFDDMAKKREADLAAREQEYARIREEARKDSEKNEKNIKYHEQVAKRQAAVMIKKEGENRKYEAIRSRFAEERRGKAQAKRPVYYEKRNDKVMRDLEKGRQMVERRRLEMEAARAKAEKEAAEMKAKAEKQREEVQRMAEKQRQEMMENRYK